MSLSAYHQHKVLWPIPQTVPRRKTCIYLFLIGLTGILIYFYSYPLSSDSWAYIKQKIVYNNPRDQQQFQVSEANSYPLVEARESTDSVILPGTMQQKDMGLEPTEVTAVTNPKVTTGMIPVSPSESERTQELKSGASVIAKEIKETVYINTRDDSETTPYVISKDKHSPATSERIRTTDGNVKTSKMTSGLRRLQDVNEIATSMPEEVSSNVTSPPISKELHMKFTKSLTQINENDGQVSQSTQATSLPTSRNISASVVSSDLTTSPVDKNDEKHKPLTRAEGHVLFLNMTATQKLADGHSYTCCYKSLFRDMEGQSDNTVGYGKMCIPITEPKTTVQDEFIAVECKNPGNETAFYKEFHSFIFDKPKVEKRCSGATADNDRYSVLIIGVDAVSRLNMHRQLNATARYLLREMGAVEMLGFNKVGDNTFPNLVPLLTGYAEKELPSVCWENDRLPLDRCDFMWKVFARKGYRTLYAEDSPHISTFNYVKNGFYLQPTDYYFRPFILAYEDALGRDKPLNCYLCVGSTSETEAVLHYTQEFTSHFGSKRPHFAFSWINSATHDFLNTGSSVDLFYEGFFRSLHRSGVLNRTIVVLMGDHGMRWGEIRHTYVGSMEERLPMLLISLPPEFKRNYPVLAANLERNSRRLTTPFDLHATLVHLLDLKGSNRNSSGRAISLFDTIPKDRSCRDASIDEQWCTCEESVSLDLHKNGSKGPRLAAEFLVGSINDLLRPMAHKCAPLKLESITGARLWLHKFHENDGDIYTVTVQTTPGEAMFEGTVKIKRTIYNLLGTISRLNLYGNQSHCVDDATLKKYCYCL